MGVGLRAHEAALLAQLGGDAGVGIEDVLALEVGHHGGELGVLVHGEHVGMPAALQASASASPYAGAMCTTPVPSSVVTSSDRITRNASCGAELLGRR